MKFSTDAQPARPTGTAPMRIAAMNEIKQTILMCHRMDIPLVTVHPGFVQGIAFLAVVCIGSWLPYIIQYLPEVMAYTDFDSPMLQLLASMILFGVIAYVNYNRPPVREKVHPSVVPVIAPITYCRAHPMTDPGDPDAKVHFLNRHGIKYFVEDRLETCFDLANQGIGGSVDLITVSPLSKTGRQISVNAYYEPGSRPGRSRSSTCASSPGASRAMISTHQWLYESNG